MIKQAKKFINELECNGKFADANLVEELLDRIAELESKLDGCSFQGGHSEAYLKAKGRLK